MADSLSPLNERLAVFKAIRRNDVTELRTLHAKGVMMNVPTMFAGKTQTPLEFARREGRQDVVVLLVELGLGADAAPATSATSGGSTARKSKAAKAAAPRAATPGAPKIAKAVRTELDRLGCTIADAPLVNPSSLELDDATRWIAHLAPPAGAFAAGSDVRELRFVRPFLLRRGGPFGDLVVLGQTLDHWLTLPAQRGDHVRFVPMPTTPREGSTRSTLATFLAHLQPDREAPQAIEVNDPVTFSPRLESLVLASLADVGVHDVQPGAIPARTVASLDTLRLVQLDSVEELDERFAALTTLAIRDATLDDLAPLARLPRLRRLMFYGCMLRTLEPLAALAGLEELHLPHCLMTEAQLEVLRRFPSLKAVTLTGNRLTASARPLLDALPRGIDRDGTNGPSLALNAQLAAQAMPCAGVVRGPRAFCAVFRDGRVRFGSLLPSGGNGEIQRALKDVTTLGESPMHEDSESLLAWPAERRVGPSARMRVPPEILDQLERLGVTSDEQSDTEPFATATLRRLARARWPTGVFVTENNARIEMTDFRGTRLHRSEAIRPARACLGSFSSDHELVLVAESADPDPHVYTVEVSEPEYPAVVDPYPLSKFLRSLRAHAT